jgi:hypothetical protein
VFAFILDRRLNAVSIRTALSAAIALSVVSTGTAQAELFWPHYRSWGLDDYGPVRPHHYRSCGWGDYEPFRQKRRRANKGYELEQKPKSQEVVKGPLQIPSSTPSPTTWPRLPCPEARLDKMVRGAAPRHAPTHGTHDDSSARGVAAKAIRGADSLGAVPC